VPVAVPGCIGARSVKWLTAIRVQPGPSENYFQASDFSILPADADPETAGPGEGISLSSPPLNPDILVPGDDMQIPAGPLTITGWALAGDGRGIGRVDVSLYGGRIRQQADLQPVISPTSWPRTPRPTGPRLSRVVLTSPCLAHKPTVRSDAEPTPPPIR
jgi:sulfite oxidase